jgi:asparagine synthase (glutamine-hydrolysing)
MLTKVDLMSMANSLEVRSPLLDYRLVDFVGQLPESYKIDRHRKKKLLIDAFKADIPEVVYNRPKHGFEVPLLKWFRGPLKSRITTLLNDETLFPPVWFNRAALDEVLRELDGNQPKEVSFKIWSLLVWAHWYKKNR